MPEKFFSQPVVVHIKSRQETEGEVHELDITSRGRYSERKNGCVLEYDEAGEDGSVATTTLTAAQDSLFLTRTGMDGIHMFIEKGRTTSSLYNTPMGSLTLRVYPRKVHMCLSRQAGEMDLSYVVDYAGERRGDHTISVSWRALP